MLKYNLKSHDRLRTTMLRHYLRTAGRNLLKRKGYSAINIAGLSIGIAVVILIALYARHELTYDRYHADAERVYQVYKERITPTGTQITRDTWVPLADRLKREYPAVENTVRMETDQAWVRSGEAKFEESVTYTESSLFDIFDFPLTRGDERPALSDPNSVVISQTMAQKYFGAEDPIGKMVRIVYPSGQRDYVVSGVMEDTPTNSSIQIDLAVPIASMPWYENVLDDWGSSFLFTYVRLRSDADAAKLEAQFPELIRAIWDEETVSRTNFKLEPLTELYNATTGNRRYAYILIGIAVLILVIAAINFTNLATVRSMERAREIGMRKVLGAGRLQLARQFMGEATVLSLLALMMALLLVKISLPFFNDLYGLGLSLHLTEEPVLLAALVLLSLIVGLASGSYPALVISRFRPVESLQRGLKAGQSRIRSGLVVTQFALAIALISATLIMRHQIEYVRNAELKFDRENVIVIPVEAGDFEDPEAAAVRLETFKDQLRRRPEVVSVSSASHSPGRWSGSFNSIKPEGWGDQNPLRMRRAYVDADYFGTYDMPIVEGRAFDEERPTDRDESVIINEAALRAFGWTAAAGKTLERFDGTYTVVGVVRDYHFASLRNEIEPVLHFYAPAESSENNFIAVRTNPGEAAGALDAIRLAWRSVDPDREPPYAFVSDTFAQLYDREVRLATVAGAFTALAILIACLGLFGIASWSVAQRVKEVGIRKVLGASIPQIVLLLSRDFVMLVGIAIVVAIPIAYLGASRWLEEFAYHVEIGPATFAVAGLMAAAIACATVSLQSTRVALTNPAMTLKQE